MPLHNESEVVSLAIRPTVSESVWLQLRSFSLDSWTGNVTLNIKDGRILCLRVEEITNGPRP